MMRSKCTNISDFQPCSMRLTGMSGESLVWHVCGTVHDHLTKSWSQCYEKCKNVPPWHLEHVKKLLTPSNSEFVFILIAGVNLLALYLFASIQRHGHFDLLSCKFSLLAFYFWSSLTSKSYLFTIPCPLKSVSWTNFFYVSLGREITMASLYPVTSLLFRWPESFTPFRGACLILI